MAPKGKASVVEVPVEDPAEEEEPPAEEEPVAKKPYVPVHPPKNPHFYPARGPLKPHMQQVLSEPDLRREYLGLPHGQSQVHADPAKGHADYRKGLTKLLTGLERQTAKRKHLARKEEESAKYREETRQAHQLFLASNRMEKQKPAWTYTDGPTNFEQPELYEHGPSQTCSRNQMLTGMFDVPHPDFRPPHFECNVHGGWNYFDTNLRGETLYEFKDKAWQKTPMSPQELKFQDRLDKSIERMTAQSAQDALNNTQGFVKKQRVFDAAGEHSCLKRGKQPWAEKRQTHHTFFQTYPPYKPGDFPYETGIGPFITETDRAFSYKRQIIIGKDNQRKSFWQCPKGQMSGSNRRQVRAQELLFANTRGATELRPPSPTVKRHVLLRGTGSLSFSCFKDALVQPPYERFSPGDCSEPP